MPLAILFAESALELVPSEISRSPAVVSDSRRRAVDPSRILLDRSFHHSAMSELKDSEKRGRPDLVHAALLSVTGSPLYLEGGVELFVHTWDNLLLVFEPRTRVPKHYLRFRGLMEKAIADRPVGELVRVHRAEVKETIRNHVVPDLVVGLSVQGRTEALPELASRLMAARKACVVVGGFPHGHFSKETLESVDELVRVHPRPLEAHVVASRLVYEAEQARGRTKG